MSRSHLACGHFQLYFTPDAAALVARLRATPGAQPAPTPSVPRACAGPYALPSRPDPRATTAAVLRARRLDYVAAWRVRACRLLLDVVLPLSDAAVDAACDACTSAAALWTGWMAAAEKLDQRKTMTVFAHDSKVRATCLAMTTDGLVARFGADDGRTIAMADAGPLDIADRGSAQNAAAATNFDDSEKDQSVLDMMKIGLDDESKRGANPNAM